MAKKRSKSTPDDEHLVDYYYYHIWKNRLDWTKHVIPVRVKDPNTGFFVESFINSPPIIVDICNQVTEVTNAFLPVHCKSTITVPLTEIYPTKRKLSSMNEKGEIVPLDLFYDPKFDPKEEIPLEKLEFLFNYYKLPFTLKELSSLLNREITPDHVFNLKQTDKKLCTITSDLSSAYFKKVEQVIMEFPKLEEKIEFMSDKLTNSLKELKQIYKGCQSCSLGTARAQRLPDSNPIFGRLGHTNIEDIITIPDKVVLFIGEAPGVQEEEKNITFYNEAPAGGVLYRVLSAANINYDHCYFTNAVLCRPESNSPNLQNGKPDAGSIDTCNTRLKNEIALIKPSIVVLLGRVAYRAFFGKEPKNILKSVGWLSDVKNVYFLPHPSYIVRELSFAAPGSSKAIKEDYLNHFINIKQRLDQI